MHFIPVDPTTCPNGPEILAYAAKRGLEGAMLVREPAFGWHLASKTAPVSLIGEICIELDILSGGGCQEWHQIAPEKFELPEIRRARIEASLPPLQRAMGCEFRVHEDAGHPWSSESGWSLMTVDADDNDALSRFITEARKKFWEMWIRGENCDPNAAANGRRRKLGAVLYKPRNARSPWQDPGHGLFAA